MLRYEKGVGWVGSIGMQRMSVHLRDRGTANEFLWPAGLYLEPTHSPVSIRVSAVRFDSFLVMHALTSSLSVEWKRERVRAGERVVVIFTPRGAVSVSGVGALAQSALCTVIIPQSGTVRIMTAEQTEVMIFSFDQGEIGALAGRLSSDMRPPDQSAVLRACYGYLRGLVYPGKNQVDNAPVLRELTRACAKALAAELVAGEASDGSLIASARLAIRTNLHAQDFNAGKLASLLDVNRRTLEREFARNGQTIAGAILDLRLQQAFDELMLSPEADVETVAFNAGFSSVASLRRGFTKRYGALPGQRSRAHS